MSVPNQIIVGFLFGVGVSSVFSGLLGLLILIFSGSPPTEIIYGKLIFLMYLLHGITTIFLSALIFIIATR